MKLSDLKTGNEQADQIFRFMVAHCASMPGPLGQHYRDGVTSMFFNWRYLAHQNDLEKADVKTAIEHLVDAGYIRVDPMFDYGIHVWLQQPVEELVA